ncbi:carbamoyl-phosphate synthase small subunit [Pelagirhabdus alkalitolerans]|uniref:Carbamoyl phosphate synthase small chain n=1 Tax=Pelagirhabdus alkalitolerans TaxID=1612202 RepID=A0A1G6H376_9BACI|nr:carbamoyl phosphate synthase small subunit [Pelagirhabdus alkalitolerans]SDB87876.1 carbamoyl-phosphate synthase small subunit [Pelagirhabdus alkalitolerans]
MIRDLILEDGTLFTGQAIGSTASSQGEVVFNTGMTGYQEILTDPSYCGQFVTMTYPLIGNYGINLADFESIEPSIHGLVVKESCDTPSNFRSEQSVDAYLKSKEIPGIAEIDTRSLTKIIRKHGTMRAILTEAREEGDVDENALDFAPFMTDQVERVSTKNPYVVPGRGHRVVVIDYGMKHGILRDLTERLCHIIVVPYTYTTEEILALKPDGIMLTNGPGDPKNVPEAIEVIKELQGHAPIFGICLGHQLIALANGADTEKMTFGHRGSNHPVKDLHLNKTFITSQNHGYAVRLGSLENTHLDLTHVAINDDSVEGVKHKDYPVFSVQYHPESAPGPEDSGYLFDQFIDQIKQYKQHSKEAK